MEKKLNHLMVDIETLDVVPGAAIVSIGAISFDINTGETGQSFYKRVSLKSCTDLGLTMNPDTVMWWMQQNEQARLEICKGGDNIKDVLTNFAYFINWMDSNNDVQIWGNSNRFDLGILHAAYNACGIKKLPWKYSLERDVRTLVSFAPHIKDTFVYESTEYTAHHPLYDCMKQIGYCSKIFREKNLKNNLVVSE